MTLRAGWLCAAAATLLAGCGAQEVLLETEGERLFSGFDALARPGRRTQLRARLQAGDLLEGQRGYVVRFRRGGALYRAAETDADGVATVSFTPRAAGDYVFTADLSPRGFADDPPNAVGLLVACRKVDEPMCVVDMDKTVVASGFHEVLVGEAEPMDASARVMKRLAKRRTVIYLTHRPDYFNRKSKAWLARHGFPRGPVLLSRLEEFIRGSGAFKTEALRRLRERFSGIDLGIGDKISDVLAYHENDIRAILVFHEQDPNDPAVLRRQAEELAELPDAIHVVTDWEQVEAVLFDGASYPPGPTRKRLLDGAQRLEADKEGKP